MRHLSIVFVATLFVCNTGAISSAGADEASPAAAIGSSPAASQHLRQQLATAWSLNHAGNHAQASQVFARVLDDAAFRSLPPDQQHAAISAAGWSAVQLGDRPRAVALYERAVRLDGSDPEDWYQLAALHLDDGKPEPAAVAFIEVIERWPHLLPNVQDRLITTLAWKLDWESPQRLALMQALFDANWNSRVGNDDEVWYDLAVAQAERGDMRAASAAMRRIDSPDALVRLRSDRRFDAVIPADGSTFDAANAARRRIDALREQAELSPRDLEVRSRLASTLLTAGRHEEVLALVEQTLAAIVDAPGAEPAFTDLNDQVWLMNSRAIALRRMGRIDEALAELGRAAELTEGGGENVSQRLNLGAFHCSRGRPDEALRAVASVGSMVSGYGRMVETGVRHCAAMQKGQRRQAAKALDYLSRHRTDGRIIYLEALLRAGDMDEASALLLEMLDSPERRANVLLWAQDYLRPSPLPGDVDARAARVTLLARDDVAAAIARVGRIGHYDLYLEGSMD